MVPTVSSLAAFGIRLLLGKAGPKWAQEIPPKRRPAAGTALGRNWGHFRGEGGT
jgi:hypothetical protein